VASLTENIGVTGYLNMNV